MYAVVVDYLERYQSAVRGFIHGSSCQKAVLGAILVNTLSMGVEHHEQVRRQHLCRNNCPGPVSDLRPSHVGLALNLHSEP